MYEENFTAACFELELSGTAQSYNVIMDSSLMQIRRAEVKLRNESNKFEGLTLAL